MFGAPGTKNIDFWCSGIGGCFFCIRASSLASTGGGQPERLLEMREDASRHGLPNIGFCD